MLKLLRAHQVAQLGVNLPRVYVAITVGVSSIHKKVLSTLYGNMCAWSMQKSHYQGRVRVRPNPPLNQYLCPLTSIFEELESRFYFHQSYRSSRSIRSKTYYSRHIFEEHSTGDWSRVGMMVNHHHYSRRVVQHMCKDPGHSARNSDH